MRVRLAVFSMFALAQPAWAQSPWTVIPSNEPSSRIVAATWGDGTRVVARCDAGRLTAFLRSASTRTGPAVYVLTQRENDAPTGGWWVVSNDGSSAVSRTPRYFVRDLRQGGRLDIVVKSRDAPDWETTLALPDQTAELDRVMSDCDLAATANPPLPERPAAQWKERPRPTASDFPAAALSANVSGQAKLSCLVSATSQAESCIVIEEAPADAGFGAAAAQILSRGILQVARPSESSGDVPAFTVTIRMPIDGRPLPELAFSDRVIAETKGLFPEEGP